MAATTASVDDISQPAAASSARARSASPGVASTAADGIEQYHDIEAGRACVQAGGADAVVGGEPADHKARDAGLAQGVKERRAVQGGVRVAVDTSSPSRSPCRAARRSARTTKAAPGVPATQCTGHGPPCALNEQWPGGCQSRLRNTGRSRERHACSSRLSGGITRSPFSMPSAPPGRKSTCRSTTSSASPGPGALTTFSPMTPDSDLAPGLATSVRLPDAR